MILAETLAWCKVKGEIKFPLHVGKKIYNLGLLQPELLLFKKKNVFTMKTKYANGNNQVKFISILVEFF